MAYPISIKEKAITLRKQGYSIKEVANKLKIAKSTSSTWLENITLSSKAQKRLFERKILGQYKSRIVWKNKHKLLMDVLNKQAVLLINKLPTSTELYKLCSALLFWCEGNKRGSHLQFTNSDPLLIQVFLTMLRKGFNIDESKFRVLMHLHQYHNEIAQAEYWHKITKISVKQFSRTYWKPNTGKNIHENYPGCIAIKYYDCKVAKELFSIYNTLANRGVGQW